MSHFSNMRPFAYPPTRLARLGSRFPFTPSAGPTDLARTRPPARLGSLFPFPFPLSLARPTPPTLHMADLGVDAQVGQGLEPHDLRVREAVARPLHLDKLACPSPPHESGRS